jgi:hypothetical protein
MQTLFFSRKKVAVDYNDSLIKLRLEIYDEW